MNTIHKNVIFLLLLGIAVSGPVCAERIKDIASIEGVRSNQLVGYGLVVGLDKSGDKTTFTGQSLRSMLTRLGITLPPGLDPKSKKHCGGFRSSRAAAICQVGAGD